jgi:hypothetical protein
VNEVLAQARVLPPPASVATPEQFEALVRDFWFKGMLVTGVFSSPQNDPLSITC